MALDIFNAKMQEFLNDLVAAFPDVQDFKMCKSALTLALSFYPKKPQEIFNTYVAVPYKSFIIDKNEEFFLSHDFKHVVNSDADFDIVERIRNVWGVMSDTDKESVWKYFQILLVLNQKIVG